MNCEDIAGNPWASFNARERSVQKCSNEIIDNRFPNNFKRTSSIVICNLCQVLILKSQTLHHFKTIHNKKITKKNSKFIIPYNAIEFYDFICECKTKKIILPKKSTKNGELFPLNKQKSDVVIDIEKETIDAINRKSSKQPNKPIPISDESIEEAEKENNIDDKNSICRDFSIDLHIDKESIQLTPFLDKYFEQDECKPISQKSILNSQSEIIDTRSSKMNNELKLNIKFDSNGILTSSFIGESNIFDRMSNLCDNRHCNTEMPIKNEPILKQVNDDKTLNNSCNSKKRMSTTENPAPVKAPRKPKSVQLRERVVGKPHRSKPFSQHKRVLRPSITPGTVLILLTGVHRGRRVVCLRQLASGLLLVTGPYCVNGVPLRRVHQKFVIATRTKLDLSTVQVPESVNDAFFQRARKSQRKSSDKTDDIFAKKTDKYSVTEERKDAQKTVDKALVAVVKAHSDRAALVHYLRTPFSLSHGDRPHNMIF